MKIISTFFAFVLVVVITTTLLTILATPSSSPFVSANQLGSAVELMISKIRATDASITAAMSQTWTTSGKLKSALTKVSGKGGASQNIPASSNSCLRMGRLSEVIIAFTTLKLRERTSFATSLDVEVSSSFMPNGVRLIHPTQGTPITYTMLLRHTSTITDANFEAATLATPNTVGTQADFVRNYFVDGAGNLNAAVFGSANVGTAAAFSPARANYALLAHVLEQIIAASAPEFSGLKDYISKEVLTPFGMSSTFWLDPDGSTPGIHPVPSFSGTFTTVSTTSTTVYSQYFDGCIIDRISGSVSIHPAWAADYMGYTTVGDLGRLAYQIFLNPDNTVFASLMQTELTLDSSVTQQMRQGQVGQGLGINFFNGDAICSVALGTFVVSSCPLSNMSRIGGFASFSQTSSLGFFCTPSSIATTRETSSSLTSATAHTCVAVGLAAQSTRTNFDALFAIAGASTQEDFGTQMLPTITTASPSGTYRNQEEEDLYGIAVLFGSFMTFVAVLLATVLAQYCLMPTPVASVTDTGGAAVADVTVVKSPGQKR